MRKYRYFSSALFVLLLVLSADAVRSQQPGAPGTSKPVITGQESPAQPHLFNDNKENRHSWLSASWMTGEVIFTDGKSFPAAGERAYLNFDLYRNVVYVKTDQSSVELESGKIESFRVTDGLGIHSFVRLPDQDRSSFFEELTDDKTGFSLYRLRQADATQEDPARPRRFSHASDNSRYYLIYPDKKTTLRFRLSRMGLRKKLKAISPVAAQFMEEHEGEINRQFLFRLCEVLNEKPLPSSLNSP